MERYPENDRILSAHCPELPETSDLSWLPQRRNAGSMIAPTVAHELALTTTDEKCCAIFSRVSDRF